MKDPTLIDNRLAAKFTPIETQSVNGLFDKEQKRTKNENQMMDKNHDCDQSHTARLTFYFKSLTNRSKSVPLT
ncbi:hypothetical protein NE897_04500 [Yersinia ruckeri]|uniref:Uncharacterized protein n=1 Tax=Yersinia ruckeri TaxID=29486 RepID=A0A0A5FPP2_YERRU|nr:hypothetical protein [Yersinia ruckeri]AKA38553.1 hypothetical protein UGYR_09195 [Yersinia ruckeri]AUQ41365.1 hypothetical protein NJ56_05175 [Yersinia ruckeri]EKN3347345.1 hypothetical protein [Yersinia ruckeri]EKN3362984.1 hypothetical protein [Yersinia ruckeri]EKN4183925.1 hypothetical protein [Yersinia ruckeri]